MKIDLYTKSILTIIACSLTIIAAKGIAPSPAIAQLSNSCGSSINPCHVTAAEFGGLAVHVTNLR